MTRAAWTDQEQLISDLTLWLDNEPNHTKARLLVRAIAHICWQTTVITEVKSEVQQLEAVARAR
jgi:hypothetical protein